QHLHVGVSAPDQHELAHRRHGRERSARWGTLGRIRPAGARRVAAVRGAAVRGAAVRGAAVRGAAVRDGSGCVRIVCGCVRMCLDGCVWMEREPAVLEPYRAPQAELREPQATRRRSSIAAVLLGGLVVDVIGGTLLQMIALLAWAAGRTALGGSADE